VVAFGTPVASVLREAGRGDAADGPVPAQHLEVVEAGTPGRERLETYIAGVYRDHFGARIAHWAPTLVGLRGDGGVLAAAGYRDATDPLFLERYLPAPIEAVISARAGVRVARREVVEVGHFAAARAGDGRRLLPPLARHLAQSGYRWVVSTATRELRLLLARLGMRPLALARADPALLGDAAADWGCYYEHEPVVVAGDLVRSLPLIEHGGKRTR
jgi:hypothetical protein